MHAGRNRWKLVLVAIATGSLLTACGASAQTSEASKPPSVKAVATWQLQAPGMVAFADGSAWIPANGILLRVDPSTNRTIAKIPIGAGPAFSWVTTGDVWVATEVGAYEVDPGTDKVIDFVKSGGRLLFDGSLWDMGADGRLEQIDPAGGRLVSTTAIQGPVDWQPQLAAGFGSVWVASGDDHAIVRVDPTSHEVQARIRGISTDYSLLCIGAGFGSVWAYANAASHSGVLYRIDPSTDKVVTAIQTGDQTDNSGYGGSNIAFGDGSVWVADDSSLTRVDPQRNRVTAVVQPPVSIEFMSFGYGSLWVNENSTDVLRLDPAIVRG